MITACYAGRCRRAAFCARYCFSFTPRGFFSILENKLIGYADDSTLIAVVPSPCVRVIVAESLSRDLKVNGKVFYGQEPPSGESTATECAVNY